MGHNRDQTIEDQLSQLAQMDTVSPFCQVFYRLIAQYVSRAGEPATGIGNLFAGFLSREVWYHEQIDRAGAQGQLSPGDHRSLADKRRIGLELLAEEAETTRCGSPQEEIGRQLVLAECYYHTAQTAKVVAHLEAAAYRDSHQSLIQFALGYNRYILALEAFVRSTADPGKRLITDYISFQRVCLQAAAAFERVLSGRQSDRHVYEWIGRVLATAGFQEAAQQAFVQAEAAEHNYTGEISQQDEPELNAKFSGEHMLSELPPITQAEIEQATELLNGSLLIEELWPYDDHDWQN